MAQRTGVTHLPTTPKGATPHVGNPRVGNPRVGNPHVGNPVRRRGVTAVSGSLVELLRTVRRSKARLAAAATSDVESATQLLLRTVAAEGPMRTSALAASVQADLSTVSRQVTTLVGRGLLERQADQLDGRVSLLVLTDAGRAAIATHEQAREQFFDQVLTGWTDDELRQFTGLLDRFTAAYDQTHTQWMTPTR